MCYIDFEAVKLSPVASWPITGPSTIPQRLPGLNAGLCTTHTTTASSCLQTSMINQLQSGMTFNPGAFKFISVEGKNEVHAFMWLTDDEMDL